MEYTTIGYDDGVMTEEKRQQLANKKLERDKITLKPVFMKEERKKEFLKDYDCVVVNSFGDDYHLSDEELANKDIMFKAVREYKKETKNIHRKIDEFVTDVRKALKCLDIIAEENGIYEPDKFKKMFWKKKIKIVGLKLPKYKGRDRKHLSWDYIKDFILSDKDPSELIVIHDDIDFSEPIEKKEKRLFDEGELDKIMEPLSGEAIKYYDVPFDPKEDEVGESNTVIINNRKEDKKLLKKNQELVYFIKELRRDQLITSNLTEGRVSQLSSLQYSDFDALSEYDSKYNYESKSDIPEFSGDIMSDDYYKYLLELEEYELDNVTRVYAGKVLKERDIKELELKEALDENNWNIRNFVENKRKEAEFKEINRREKKREKKLKKKLLEVDERRRRRMRDPDSYSKEDYKLLKKKKKKKKEEKERKKETVKKLKENYDRAMAAPAGEKSMEDWENRVLDFTSKR